MKTSTLRKKLTIIFNKYIRIRDRYKGCISCTTGKVENAGHFRSTGSSPQASMRFDDQNVNGQCIRCNFTLGGNFEGYKKGFIRRYGAKAFENLEVKMAIRQNPWGPFEYLAAIEKYTKLIEKHGTV